jgi:hypothetical protein
VNVDVAVSKVGDKGVGAAFCRDHSGLYMGASPVVYTGITDPAVLEALACREALALALDLGISHLLVASDCKTVVNDISDGSMGRYGSIIAEINARTSQFNGCKFIFEGRSSNFEAHNLARFVLSLDSGRYLWLGAPYAPHIPVNIIIVADLSKKEVIMFHALKKELGVNKMS